MKNIERTIRRDRMVAMRDQGMTQAQIGEVFGVSRQRVHTIIGKNDKRYFRALTKERCVWDGVREWMNKNQISVSEMTKLMYGNNIQGNQTKVADFMRDKAELRKRHIDKILSITGLTYEKAFVRDE